jgi:CRISPR system Cascade subunit CasA
MNVAFDEWIPVVEASGRRKLASLRDVLVEGERFADLAVRPHERVSLMRLFLCIAHAALEGPKNYDEWCEVSEKLPVAAGNYLANWKGSFELFHSEKPWLQIPGLSKTAEAGVEKGNGTDWTPVSKLNLAFSSGINSTLYDHGALDPNRRIPIEGTALSILAFQCFSPGGTTSQAFWNGTQTKKIARDAPCIPASMTHAFLRGVDLKETLHLNLATHEDIGRAYGDLPLGQPVWERMPSSFADKPAVENATRTYLGRLVPLTRLTKLAPDGQSMLLGDGLVYPTFADGFSPEPTATVAVRRDKRALVSYHPGKAIWRELGAIAVKRTADGTGGPLALGALQEGVACDLIVGALARQPGQANLLDATESVFHVPARFRAPEGTAAYEVEVKNAEAQAARLGWAVETYRTDLDAGWPGKLKVAGPKKSALKARLHALATTHYWTAVESRLDLLMRYVESIGTDSAMPARELWRRETFTAACEAYHIACGLETPRQMRAFARGWEKLTAKKTEGEADEPDSTEEEAV